MGVRYCPHLDDRAARQVALSPEERIRIIRSPFWFEYDAATRALATLRRLLDRPVTKKLEGVAVISPYGNGKSTLVRRFADEAVRRGVAERVLYVSARGGGLKGLLQQVWSELGNPLGIGLSSSGLRQRSQVERRLVELEISVLIIDEFGTLLRSTPSVREAVFSFLCNLGSAHNISTVLVGDADMGRRLFDDGRMAVRIDHVMLPRWPFDDEFGKLLRTLESVLPLERASRLTEFKTAKTVFELSGGIIGEVTKLVTRAAEAAVLDGQERVTVAGIIDQRDQTARAKGAGLDWSRVE